MTGCSDSKPDVFESIGNGSWYYNWDIVEEKIEIEGEEPRTQYNYKSVIVYNPLTSNAVVRTVLNELWGNDHEQKLVNEYNSANFGLLDEEASKKAIAAYKEFLEERAKIKASVEKDCSDNGIK